MMHAVSQFLVSFVRASLGKNLDVMANEKA